MRGFTLIELIVSIAILCIFLGLGVPKMQNLIERHQSHSVLLTLHRALTHARIKAQDQLINVTLCPMVNETCSNNWNNPIAIFHDENSNNALDLDEQLLFQANIDTRFGYWLKSKANQNFVRFDPLGHAFSSATTFLYCPYSNHDQLARSIVINFQGRIKTEHYLNNQGTPYAKFANLNCN